ncbi:GNAT family N-acetyltransferase [Nonomuraea soli]|uniref:GNAT superfamily N-acetyltransferase n=1 Tax=Nonomuraea soli TaxID=1032476 RepID=A0A7W0HR63_9ACTN|nr:GNAT family N-acetyltransferase [Nonomuraea soli]MBA2892301.1 GNAT superfamily N-acetyltransferase [Nonomuraea soli]
MSGHRPHLPDYQLLDRAPTIAEYERLCRVVGWLTQDFSAAPRALAASLACVVIEHRGRAVAMARLVGDGAMYFYVQDFVVHPDHRRHGLGDAMMRRLLEHVHGQYGKRAFVGLFATPDGAALYERHGFGAGELKGMCRLIE